MRRPKLFLHAGTQKTGTTAIQQALAANRNWLDSQGVLYPPYFPMHHGPFYAHNQMARALARYAAMDHVALMQFGLRLRRLSRGKRWVVLSAESIYRHVVQRPIRTPEAFAARHRAYLQRLARYFKAFEITIVLYFRRPDTFAVSRFKERIVRGFTSLDFGTFIEKQAWFYDYPGRVELLRRTFENVATRVYEAERAAGLVERFLEVLDVPSLPAPPSSPVRASPTNRATLWLRRAQEEAPRSLQAHEHRVIFAREPQALEFFTESEPSTLWPSRSCFSGFVERNSDAYGFAGFDYPSAPDQQPAVWTDGLHRTAETAFAKWEMANRGVLRRRRRLGLRFFEEL